MRFTALLLAAGFVTVTVALADDPAPKPNPFRDGSGKASPERTDTPKSDPLPDPPAKADPVKQGPRADFTSPTPINSVDTEADEMHPWITATGRELYFSRKTKEGWRVYVASRPGS